MTGIKIFFQKIEGVKKIFSLDFLLKFNWLLTVFFFFLILFFALLVWWQSFVFSTSVLAPEIINQENNQDFEKKDGQIKKVIEALEKRREGFANFPAEALPRERVFKSEFVWEEESAPVEEEPKDASPQDKIVF